MSSYQLDELAKKATIAAVSAAKALDALTDLLKEQTTAQRRANEPR